MREITCALCGSTKMRNTGEVNRAARTGASLYCSRACMFTAKRTGRKALGWHERRFEKQPGAVNVACAECERPMWLPPSKVHEYKRCGPECNAAWRKRQHEALQRDCETCGASFRPRPIQIRNGGGRYCSQQCNPSDHLITPQALANAQEARRQRVASGAIYWNSGPEHHSWKGGKSAALARRRDSGKLAAGLRRYRAANKHKVREWKQHRKNAKLERLPYGTIPRIGTMQRWKCAVCSVGIKNSYHLDHIMPIARGGKHEPRNLQLLCPSCNVRKSAKDPITFMQERGRLL